MNTMEKTKITVEATVNAPVEKVWKIWTGPEHIVKWNSGHPDWHTPKAENDLRVGGRFLSRMEAKDGSMGFDFGGVYNVVDTHKRILYTMDDGRQADTTFQTENDKTHVTTVFDAESQNPVEMQKGGWQAIMDNFKSYTETN
jgi:uncharacterized protein YndB with AHSA1/START domain